MLVHESGHYLSARGLGIRVEEFSIGFGPRLAGFRAFGDQFNLRVLPLGGYVRFPENYDAEAAREQEAAAMQAVDELVETKLDTLQAKALNALTLGAVGEEEIRKENQRRLEAAEEIRNRPWWKMIAGGQRLPPEEDLTPLVAPDDLEIEYDDDPQLLQNRPWQERAVVLSGGVLFNFLLSFSIYFGLITAGAGLPSPSYSPGALVSSTPSPNAAASGLLQSGDVVLDVNGKSLCVSPKPSVSEAQKGINDFIQQIRATPDGETLQLTVRHPGESGTVQVKIEPQTSSAGGIKTIGVLLQPNVAKAELLKSTNIPEAAGMAYKYTTSLIQQTATGLLSALSDIVRGRSGGGLGPNISGPIGLIKAGTEVLATNDYTSVLLFTAALSINLGVVNAFPIPALDGGQLLFVLSEAISGRKVDQRVQEGITGAAILLLLLVSAGAAFGDLESIFLSR